MSLIRKLRSDVPIMQATAVRWPLSATGTGGIDPRLRRAWRSGDRAATAILTVERCGCLDDVPLWHASVSLYSLATRQRLDDGERAFTIAETLLDNVGISDTLWWWNPDSLVGHLRSHLGAADRPERVPPSVSGPADHDEPGLWYRRRVLFVPSSIHTLAQEAKP